MQIIWTKEALADLDYHITWYLTHASIEVSQKFSKKIEESLINIQNNPYGARTSLYFSELREYVLHKYPYIISYYVNDSEIILTSIIHQKREHFNRGL
ncbi:MAG: type II toxin-antitoxin system RelE/ParE family toxin [Alphaproteobacteria bacterium]|nr:type II toxin-antitoxin system RelE/ParE family toxin [Alphaproteobacteria bacterium]